MWIINLTLLEIRYKVFISEVAHRLEHSSYKRGVEGSIPSLRTNFRGDIDE